MPFWTRPWDVMQANKSPQFTIIQNHNFLELGGEPCYLLQRKQEGESVTGTKLFPFEYDGDLHRFYVTVWSPSDGDANYPDPRHFSLSVDTGSGSTEWTQVQDSAVFTAGNLEYYLYYRRNYMDEEQNTLPDTVRAYLNTPPFPGTSTDTVSWNFSTICACWDLNSFQPTIAECPTCHSNAYGWEQYLDPNFTYRNRNFPHGVLLAFPSFQLDLRLDDRGFVEEGRRDYWTSPPPYSPLIYEHDVIVVPSRNRRLEVQNYTWGRIDGIEVVQMFDASDVEKDSPSYNIPVVTS